jgi:hypothetical protein
VPMPAQYSMRVQSTPELPLAATQVAHLLEGRTAG